VRANLDASLATLALITKGGVVTSSYRPPSDAYGASERGSDHTKGLAVDVSFGDYSATKSALGGILLRGAALKRVRQVIFENVRGTSAGYHIHIGFWGPEEKGEIQSLLWYSRKEATRESGVGYTPLTSAADLPGREVFENA